MEMAKWIWTNPAPSSDEYGEFYESFSFSGEKTELYISADSNYAVYLNGELCAFGQYPDFPYDKVYDTVDLTPFCRTGKNHLGIVVWYYGIDTTMVYYKGNASLLFAVKAGDSVLARSSMDTLSRQSHAYESHRNKTITRQLGLGYHYDASSEDNWRFGELSGFSKSVLVEQELPLRPRPCERLFFGEAAVGRFVKKTAPNRLLFDLGVNTVGFLTLSVVSPVKQRLTVSYGEHLVDGTVRRIISYRDFSADVTVGAGKTEYANPFRRFGGRYMEIESEEPIEVLRLGLIPTLYPLEIAPRPQLTEKENEIYDICLRTLILCTHEHYEDCPWREQGLYALDSRNQMLASYYAFKGTEYQRSNLELMSKDDRADKLLSICFPMSGDLVIPSFALHYFSSCAEYLRRTNDLAFLEEIYPKLQSILSAFFGNTLASSHLVDCFHGANYWNFYEWTLGHNGHGKGDGEGAELLLNALYSLALSHMAEIAAALGKPNSYKEEARLLNEDIVKAFYREDIGLFTDRMGDATASVLGNALAILCGAAPKERAAAMAERMVTDKGLLPPSLGARWFLFDALLLVDRDRYAPYILAEIERIYQPMLELGVGTVWETEQGEADFGKAGSLCHGWNAMPIYYYHTLGSSAQIKDR